MRRGGWTIRAEPAMFQSASGVEIGCNSAGVGGITTCSLFQSASGRGPDATA